MESMRQLWLLLRKNLLLRWRHSILTLFEVFLPVMGTALLLVIRVKTPSIGMINATVWKEFNSASVPPKDNNTKLPQMVAFTPNSTLAQSLVLDVQNKTSPFVVKFVGYSSEAEMEKNLTNVAIADKYLAGIVFNSLVGSSSSSLPSTFYYTLRFKPIIKKEVRDLKKKEDSFDWNTDRIYPKKSKTGPRNANSKDAGPPPYFEKGFLFLQDAINNVVLARSGANDSAPVALERMPFPKYRGDIFLTLVLAQQMSSFIYLSFIILASNVVNSVVTEKEKRLKELMKMMGLRGWLHWTAWYIDFFSFAVISCVLMVQVFSISTSQGEMLPHSKGVTVLFFLLIYANSIIWFSFAFSTLFDKARTAGVLVSVMHLLTYLPIILLKDQLEEMSVSLRCLLSLLPNSGFGLGCSMIGAWESEGLGLQWSNVASPPYLNDSFTMAHVWGMLIFSSVLCMIFTWYVGNVRPGEFGVPLPWYFPFTCSYWRGMPVVKNSSVSNSDGAPPKDDVEPDPPGLACSIAISDLTKAYDKSGRLAVDHLNIRIFQGQITALLGHNGAGKTTTMHMITGFIPPTSGNVFVNGVSIREDAESVRKQLGLCPQHSVLFDELTVEQHLWFFAKLKNCPEKRIQAEIDRMIASTEMEPKRHALSRTLSGGQKRKLNVAISLIGFSKVVILDEPSSGVDPNARRELWSFLQAERSGRTMLLSTHFMDEADALGDRIAIMAFGQLQCLGTPLFLKSRFGAGYHLTMVKTQQCDVPTVEEVVNSYVPAASLESNDGEELCFILPVEASSAFEGLFSRLERDSGKLGIDSFGASVTTMEEVFLRVCTQSEEKHKSAEDDETRQELARAMEQRPAVESEGNHHHVAQMELFPTSEKFSGAALLFRQFWALLVKRVLLTRRSIVLNLVQIVIPIFFLVLALVSARSNDITKNDPALNLTLEKYGAQEMVIGRPKAESSGKAATFLSGFHSEFKNRPQTTFHNLTDRISTNESEMIDFLLKEASKDIKSYKEHFVVGAYAANNRSPLVFFNGEAYHAAPIALGAAANARLQSLSGGRSLLIANHPLPKTDIQKLDQNSGGDFTIPLNLAMGLSILVSCFCYFVVLEKGTKVKLLHKIAGTNNFVYWMATFVSDFIYYLIPMVIMILLIQFLGGESYNATSDRIFGVLLLLVLYAFAVIPQMYTFSYIFDSAASAVKWMVTFNLFTGIISFIAVFIFLIIPNLKNVGNILKKVFFFVFPGFDICMGLYDYSQNYAVTKSCENLIQLCPIMNLSCCPKNCEPNCLRWTTNALSFEEGGIGLSLLGLGVQSIFYICLCLLIDSDLITRLFSLHKTLVHTSESHEDPDVTAQRGKVLKPEALFENMLVIRECSRFYGSHCAVRNISCAIPKGDCFGLLGVNGAGKTTTFKMITGDLLMSSGDIFINGISVSKESHRAQRQLGYCPQFDALLEALTARECLTLFSRLRGRPAACIKGEVQQLIDKFLLARYADRRIETYSGGNKRKLSTAVAMVGSPPVLCLDEPTTGMDPVARRHVWQVLTEYRLKGNTLVLTSHSMEECEALCTKIAIMVNGQFKCFGSCQHLKDKFGRGFTLYAKLPFANVAGGDANVQAFKEFVKTKFPASDLKDQHQGLLHYHLHPGDDITWSKVFGLMESHKEQLKLENYSVSQTTLDQIFIQFARNQDEPNENNKSCWSCFS